MAKKVDHKFEGQKEPIPNTLQKGENFGGYSVVSDPRPPEAKQSVSVRIYRGEYGGTPRSWNKHRPRATGHRK